MIAASVAVAISLGMGTVFVATQDGDLGPLTPSALMSAPTDDGSGTTSPEDPAESEADEDPPYTSREGRNAPGPWKHESGRVPTLEDSLTTMDERGDIQIRSDKDFNPAHGVRSGRGTWEEPYVISGWSLNSIRISDTDAFVILRENYVRNQLILNWNGDRVYVHHNYVHDLRVNQNVKRTGDATAGLVMENQFFRVGQIRHYDGEFTQNVVGSQDLTTTPTLMGQVAVNFDGFHGARFHHNTVYGIVDVRLHGHHHGSGFDGHSHNHGKDRAHVHEDGSQVNHSVRYHEVFVENNRIVSYTPYALRYFDRAHAANDRTAASEQNKNLSKPHVHYLKVHFVGNEVVGGAIFVDVVNAPDELHTLGASHAWIHVEKNLVTLRSYQDAPRVGPAGVLPLANPLAGVMAQLGIGVELWVTGNTVVNQVTTLPAQSAGFSGIKLLEHKDATIWVHGNRLSGVAYGVWAQRLNATTHWYVYDNAFESVKTPVYYDSSVENPPEDEPGP